MILRFMQAVNLMGTVNLVLRSGKAPLILPAQHATSLRSNRFQSIYLARAGAKTKKKVEGGGYAG